MISDTEANLQHDTPDASPQLAFYEHPTGDKGLTTPLHEHNPLWMKESLPEKNAFDALRVS